MSRLLRQWRRQFTVFWDSRSRGFRSRTIALTVVVTVAAISTLVWHRVGRPAWRDWRVRQALRQAAEFEAQRDQRNLLLALKRAYDLGPTDLASWRQISDYLSRIGVEQSIIARQQVLYRMPHDLTARVELAEEAVRFGYYALGQNTLQVPTDEAARDVAYQRVAATLALLLGDIREMKLRLSQLVAIDPTDQQARFDLAVARSRSPHATERKSGWDELTSLLESPALRISAALELLGAAARLQDAERATDVVALLSVTFPLPGQEPTTLADPADPIGELLVRLQTAASTSPADVVSLAEWIQRVRRGPAALEWLNQLPTYIQQVPAVTALRTELAIATDQLDLATELLSAGAFGPLSGSVIQPAIEARRQRLAHQAIAANRAWNEARAQAESATQDDTLRTLVHLGRLWREPEWTIGVLRSAINRATEPNWAYDAYAVELHRIGRTGELWSFYDSWIDRQPQNIMLVSRWLRLGAALPAANETLHRKAPGLLENLPASPRTTALRAGWTFLQGNKVEARRQLDDSTDPDLLDPDAAYWAVLIGRSAGNEAVYPSLQELDLLPIERALLDEARP